MVFRKAYGIFFRRVSHIRTFDWDEPPSLAVFFFSAFSHFWEWRFFLSLLRRSRCSSGAAVTTTFVLFLSFGLSNVRVMLAERMSSFELPVVPDVENALIDFSRKSLNPRCLTPATTSLLSHCAAWTLSKTFRFPVNTGGRTNVKVFWVDRAGELYIHFRDYQHVFVNAEPGVSPAVHVGYRLGDNLAKFEKKIPYPEFYIRIRGIRELSSFLPEKSSSEV